MRLNIQSVRDCDAGRLSTERGPHYVTRRYAELSAAMVGLSESFPSDQVTGLLAQLQEEVGTYDHGCQSCVKYDLFLLSVDLNLFVRIFFAGGAASVENGCSFSSTQRTADIPDK